MITRLVGMSALIALLCHGTAEAQDKKASGTVIGVVKGKNDTKDGKNTILEVLAPGEEKARAYHVIYDPKVKGPIPAVLKAVRAARVDDMVELTWVGTG